MDRISALRHVEQALADFEDGEQTLAALEREVRGILRTYATDFEEQSAYRANGDDRVDGVVVLAGSRQQARERVTELVSGASGFDVERVETL
jgi:hypothetical protein